MYLFLWVVISTFSSSLSSVLGNSFVDFLFETLVILSAILLPVKSPVTSACSFRCCFYCICCRFFSTIKKFLTTFITLTFTHVFSKRQKPVSFHIYSISWFNWISQFYTMELHSLDASFTILPSISNGLLLWSVNHTSISLYSELNVFRKIWFVREIYNTVYLEQKCTIPLNHVDNHYWPYYNELILFSDFTIFIFSYFIFSTFK